MATAQRTATGSDGFVPTCCLSEAVIVEPDGVVGVSFHVLQVAAEELHAWGMKRERTKDGNGKSQELSEAS